jgi:hypothetical protein
MSNCKDCSKVIKDDYWRCYQCNLKFKENKNIKKEGETTDESQINYYKFGLKKSAQTMRQDN